MVDHADFYSLLATLSPILMIGILYLSGEDDPDETYVVLDDSSPWWHRAVNMALMLTNGFINIGLAAIIIFYSLLVLAGIYEATKTGRLVMMFLFAFQFAVGAMGLTKQARDQVTGGRGRK